MRAMKDSGIEWIGEIPEDWSLARLKSCVLKRDGGAWGEEPQSNDGDVVCLRIADFDYQKFRFKDSAKYTLRNYDEDTITKLTLQYGDLLIEKSGGGEKTPVGRVVFFDKDIKALFANFMDRIRVTEQTNPKWFNYVMATFYDNGYTRNYIKQTTGIQNLDLTSMLAKELIFIPPIDEQQRIADYLDAKCSKIDAIISKQEAVIEKLKAYKQSIITEAVTKGLNPDVEMKDSGIEWIGEIPKKWRIASVGHIATVVRGASPRPAGDPRYFGGCDVPWITVAVVTNGDGKYIYKTTEYLTLEGAKQSRVVEPGVLLLSNSGATLGVPRITCIKGCINDGSLAFYDLSVNQEYLYYFFKSRTYELRKMMAGYGQPNLNTDIVRAIKVTIPLDYEQEEIVGYLDNKCSNIDSIIVNKQSVIDKLTAYKKSLIYEVVTGKKEVPLA